MDEFFIIDLRPEWRKNPYITLWRPNDANYAYPLVWAGRYTKAEVDAAPHYYAYRTPMKNGLPSRIFQRFPVPCAVVEALSIPKPKARIVDGDVGPVLVNDAKTQSALRSAKYLPPTKKVTP